MGLVALLVGGLSPLARAQYVPIYVDPPAGINDVWRGGSYSNPGLYDYYAGLYNWHTGSEWLSGSAPPDGVDVLFPDSYTGALRRQRISTKDLSLRSLWFEAGLWYTIEGRSLTLGTAHPKQRPQEVPYLLVVNSQDLQNTSEHTLEFEQFTIADAEHWKGVGRIENYSEGGLGIFAKQIDLNRQHIQIGGMGATHFNATLTGDGIIDVGLFGGVEDQQPQPHFILQGDNRDWRGELRVNPRGFAIVKADQALGYGGEKRVYDGGSLALRSHLENPLNYNAPVYNLNKPLQITGAGIIRREGTERIGALYNDGGRNTFGMRVEFTGDTLFGARGDRDGGLALDARVYNTTDTGHFIKVGPGLIALNNSAVGAAARNYWRGETVIRGGVLRIGNADALPNAPSSIVFEGGSNGIYPGIQGTTDGLPSYGGILELGYAGSGFGGVHHFYLSAVLSRVRWAGSGGFSAYGADRTVTLNNGATLNWGSTPNFVKAGDALLLGSRYANANITLTNDIDLGGTPAQLAPPPGVPEPPPPLQPEVRVERGEGNAHAILSGKISSSITNWYEVGRGLTKTGRGLLYLTGANTYVGATVIKGGALRGNVPSLSRLYLDGGVLGIDGTFARNLGTGEGQIQWTDSGGFAAYGGTRTVTLNGGGVIALNASYFVGLGKELRFGHYTANGTVDFKNFLYSGANGIIRVERGRDLSRADVVFSNANSILPNPNAMLSIVGDGRMDVTGMLGRQTKWGELRIYGAELRLNGQGHVSNLEDIKIFNGGTLYLDDLGTHDSATGGSVNANRINDDGTIALQGGTITYRPSVNSSTPEKVGTLTVGSGQNFIQLFHRPLSVRGSFSELHSTGLGFNETGEYGTLHFSEAQSRLRLDTSASGHNVNDAGGLGVFPWATAMMGGGWQGFAHATTEGGIHYVQALAQTSYYAGPQAVWSAGHNVRMTANQTLGANRTVNSLVLGGGTLNLSGRSLTINSGGLIATGSGTRTISGSSGQIGTANNRPLYVHAFSNLTLSGGARLNLGSDQNLGAVDLIKTGPGTLTLGGNVTHTARNVLILGGTLDLAGGILEVSTAIVVGDGAGVDVLKLAPNRWDQITGANGLPDIRLNGTPYDPRGPEYGGDQAILRMGGNTKLHLAELFITHRGTIDWVGGEVGKANILWVENIRFHDTDAQLFMRNWNEYEDILLVRNIHTRGFDISQIIFEGYENYQTTYRQWDNDYWQITPFRHLDVKPFPEPSTYGAILGALGLAVVVWRRRKQKKTPPARGARSSTGSLAAASLPLRA